VSRKVFPLLIFFVILFCISNAQAAWKVELVSGATLSANSYHIDKGRIYLEYPVGEVSFRLSELKSVSPDNQGVALFQANGIRQAKESPQAKENLAKIESNQPVAPGSRVANATGPSSPASSAPAPSAHVNNQPSEYVYDPKVEEIMSDMDSAGDDETKLADVENKINKMFEDEMQSSEKGGGL
jgi:hypothetical protein